MNEQEPRHNKLVSRAYNTFLVAAAAIAVWAVASDSSGRSPRHAETATGANPTHDIYAGWGKLDHGGMILDARVARGVDCPASQDRGWANGRWYGNELEVDSQLSGDFGWGFIRDGANPLAFVGVDSEPEFDGYYVLKSGWALRYNKRAQTYNLDHFQAEPDGEERVQGGGLLPVSKLVGQRIASTSLVGMELGGMGTWTDGQTKVAVSIDPNVGRSHAYDAFGSLIRLDVSCTT